MKENVPPSLAQSPAGIEMPRYRCHKEVWALKIKAVPKGPEDQIGSLMIVPEESGYAPFVVDREYARKHIPTTGGYESFSPASAFEEGYTRI